MAQRNGWIWDDIFFWERGRKRGFSTFNFWTFQQLNQHSRWVSNIFYFHPYLGEGFPFWLIFFKRSEIFPLFCRESFSSGGLVEVGDFCCRNLGPRGVHLWPREAPCGTSGGTIERHVSWCLRGVDDAHVWRTRMAFFKTGGWLVAEFLALITCNCM